MTEHVRLLLLVQVPSRGIVTMNVDAYVARRPFDRIALREESVRRLLETQDMFRGLERDDILVHQSILTTPFEVL